MGKGCGFTITSRQCLIRVGFLKFTMRNLMRLPPIHNRMSDHTLKIIKGTRMNSPWGTNLITARNLGCVFHTLYGSMIKGFAVSQVLEAACPLELYKHLTLSKHFL